MAVHRLPAFLLVRILARALRFHYRQTHMSPTIRKKRTTRTPLPQSERDLWLRLAIAWTVSVAMTWLMRSDFTSAFFRHPLMQQTAPAAWSYLLPLVFLFLIGIAVRSDARSRPLLARPSFEQIILALLSAALLFLLSLWLLHPSPAAFAALQDFGMRHPAVGDPLLNALLGFLILLPTLVLPFAFFPLSLLLRHRIGLLLGLLGALGFLLFPALESAYFGVTGPPLTAAVRGVLSLLPGGLPAEMSRWEVGYDDFVVTVGYACTEFSSIALLVGLLGVAFHSLSRRQSVSWGRAALAILLGILLLWLLNVARIAAIVVIGSYHRAFALTLFHSGIGLLLFLVFFLLFVKLSLPFVRAEKKS